MRLQRSAKRYPARRSAGLLPLHTPPLLLRLRRFSDWSGRRQPVPAQRQTLPHFAEEIRGSGSERHWAQSCTTYHQLLAAWKNAEKWRSAAHGGERSSGTFLTGQPWHRSKTSPSTSMSHQPASTAFRLDEVLLVAV